MTPPAAPPSPQQRVISAAAALFAEQGYAATSVRQIARQAHVSLDTVYACGGKAEIFLRALEVVLSGSPEGTPVLDAPGMDEVWNAPTLDAVVAGLVDATVAADARSIGIWPAFVEGAASDPTLRDALSAQNAAMRGEGRRAVEFLTQRGLCPAGLDTDHVSDLIWAAAHPDRYALLVGIAGWTPEQFAAQLTELILSLLEG